ncbi:serine hydrolase [Novosphingopyxis sp.]|uniref:serine hydrolase n=1 Tax=Novosphingopyxis sp. TaxID=2709690 RepID=UPI003B5C9CEF
MRDAAVKFIYVFALLTIGFAMPAQAQDVQPSPAFTQRAGELAAIVNGSGDMEDFFAPSFLAQVPRAQMAALSAQIVAQQGQAGEASAYRMSTPYQGQFDLKFDKAIGEVRMTVNADAPNQVIGLLITGFRTDNDSIAAVKAAFAALPGRKGFTIAHLTDQGPVTVADYNGSQLLGLGSSFKLYILAELADEIVAGERQWSDVVTLDRKSFPSGVMQSWPPGSPVTLATLATQMISISDNSAADMLLHVLGRERVEARLAKIGHSDPAAILPFLSTVEAFALKMDGNADLRARFMAASEAQQRDLLAQNQGKLTLGNIDITQLAGAPRFVEQIEWPAAPHDVVALLDHLRVVDAPLARQIMAVNPGLGAADSGRWDYLGFKGGSEPGVMHFAWLACTANEDCYAVVGGWTDPDKDIDKQKFTMLMSRLLALAHPEAE